MSGPRMGNMGQMNGNRRPNVSRMNYHDGRQSSYQEHRQSYQDHRQSSHEGRQHDNRSHSHDMRHHDHRPHDSRQHDNRQVPSHQSSQSSVHSQHDDLIRFIHDSWSTVEKEKGSNLMYYQEIENHHLKDFRPFDLEAYWGKKLHQQQHNMS